MQNKNALLAGIGVLVVIVAAFLIIGGSGGRPSSQESNVATSKTVTARTMNQTSSTQMQNSSNVQMRTLPDGLQVGDEVVGTGTEAVAGDTVTVHYVGVLTDGKKFDSSIDRGAPFTFVLAKGDVIKGWDEGVAGMKVGGMRRLVIPPSLGYGSRDVGNGLIPPNSTLIFEVQLLDVKSRQ